MHMNKLFQLSVGAGYGLSKNKTDGEIGHSTVTPPRSEGSVALGSEMLRCAQHDSAVIHTDVRIIVLICITGLGENATSPCQKDVREREGLPRLWPTLTSQML